MQRPPSRRSRWLPTAAVAAGLDVPAGGVTSTPLRDAELNANLDDKGPKKASLTVPKPTDYQAIPTAPIDEAREAKFPRPVAAP